MIAVLPAFARLEEIMTMTWPRWTTVLAALALVVGADRAAWSQDTLKVAIPQRGAWDAGLAELGQRGGIFKKHGLERRAARAHCAIQAYRHTDIDRHYRRDHHPDNDRAGRCRLRRG